METKISHLTLVANDNEGRWLRTVRTSDFNFDIVLWLLSNSSLASARASDFSSLFDPSEIQNSRA